MFEQTNLAEPKSTLVDWILRGVVAAAFILFGIDKFPSGPQSEWVKLFQQIGAGQWFRHFTGIVEVLGGLLVLIPRTAMAGIALLACTMASAVFILVFVLGRPADCIVSGGFLIGLVAFWVSRRNN